MLYKIKVIKMMIGIEIGTAIVIGIVMIGEIGIEIEIGEIGIEIGMEGIGMRDQIVGGEMRGVIGIGRMIGARDLRGRILDRGMNLVVWGFI